jgi:hypothetical protein
MYSLENETTDKRASGVFMLSNLRAVALICGVHRFTRTQNGEQRCATLLLEVCASPRKLRLPSANI